MKVLLSTALLLSAVLLVPFATAGGESPPPPRDCIGWEYADNQCVVVSYREGQILQMCAGSYSNGHCTGVQV